MTNKELAQKICEEIFRMDNDLPTVQIVERVLDEYKTEEELADEDDNGAPDLRPLSIEDLTELEAMVIHYDQLLEVVKEAEQWAMLTQTECVPWLEKATDALARESEG